MLFEEVLGARKDRKNSDTFGILIYPTCAQGCVKIQFNHGAYGGFTENTEFK